MITTSLKCGLLVFILLSLFDNTGYNKHVLSWGVGNSLKVCIPKHPKCHVWAVEAKEDPDADTGQEPGGNLNGLFKNEKSQQRWSTTQNKI